MVLNFLRYLIYVVLACRAFAQNYSGPVPPQPDVLYLLHADALVPAEAATAVETSQKDGTVFTIPGANSPVKTPLASPIFLLKADRLAADKLQLFPLQSRGRQREIVFSRRKKNPEPYTLTVKDLGNGIFRLEVNESLPKGEYSVSPADSNQAFCFAVY